MKRPKASEQKASPVEKPARKLARKAVKKIPAKRETKKTDRRGSGLWMESTDLQRLQEHLREAQETLEAIRNGDVDAVVVSGSHGSQVYSLSGAEEPYRIYVEQMQEGAVTVAADGLVLYSNQRFAEMTGLPLEKVISSQILQHVPETVWGELKKVFTPDHHDAVKHECLLHADDGSSLPVNLTASRLPMDYQDVMCLVVTDLSWLRERDELRLGKEGAEKANMAKDAFLAALSHELRTPLTPALMATMALEQDNSLPASARSTLGMIRRNVELEARLIDDLLDLTRIARGKLELHVMEVDAHVIINRALEICQTDIHSKQQKLHLFLDSAHAYVIADPIRLQQALWNVIRNAIKFTPARGIITIRTGNGNGTFWAEVSDTGTGFHPDMLPALFKPFEQGGREITRKFGGLGLGLAISHSIMESHQGSIQGFSSGHGLGATFTLEIPVAIEDTAKRPPSTATAGISKRTGGMRILLVEDHHDTRTSMERLLRRAGHTVTAAETATNALQWAATEEFDLVISDLGLPDLSGIDLMKKLRDEHGLKGIAVSGYGMEEDLERSRDAGFIYHLTKPIHMENLRQVILSFGENKASSNGASAA